MSSCICAEPSKHLPGDTGVVMECPVHGEAAQPVEEGERGAVLRSRIEGVVAHYDEAVSRIEEGRERGADDVVARAHRAGRKKGYREVLFALQNALRAPDDRLREALDSDTPIT